MRAWIIVLSSAVVAVAAGAAMTGPELSLAPHSGIVPSAMLLVPRFAVTALAVYALCAILLTAGGLVGAGLRLRHGLDRNPAHRWTAAIEASGLGRLAPTLSLPRLRPATVDGMIVLRGRFRPNEARREIARLYYIWAARSHFFSALIVLAAAVALGAAQQHGALPVSAGPIPTVAAALILVGLFLLAVLARVAVDITTEPLIEMLCRIPAERVEVALLRRVVELLEAGRGANPAVDDPRGSIPQIPDRLVGVLEEGHRALFDAIERLSATTDGLAVATRSAIEVLEAAVRDGELHQPPGQGPVIDVAASSRLQEAIVSLTAALENLPTWPAAGGGAAVIGPASARKEPEPDLARELKTLLQEIGAPS